jgi:hypothetical protein
MAEASGLLGNGVKVAYSLTSPHTWVPVVNIMEVGVPKLVADRVEKTTHGTGGFHSFMGGLLDVQPATLTLLTAHGAASHIDIARQNRSKESNWWRIEIPVDRELSTTQYRAVEFEGSVSEFSFDTPIADVQKTMVTIQFEGTDFAVYPAAASAF